MRSAWRLSLLGTLLLAGVIAACSGGLGDDDDDDDDDDGTNTPPPEDACTIVWAREQGAGFLDVFLVDGPIADWESGPVAFDVSTMIGVLYDDAPYFEDHVPPRMAAGAAITTSGLFELTLEEGTSEGSSVVLSDDPANQILH